MSAAKRGLGVAPWTLELSGVHGCRWNLPAAQRYCRSMVKDRDENLAHWLGLFSCRQQDALAAVYSVCRIADDLADEPDFAPGRQLLMAAWRTELLACEDGGARHPALVALQQACSDFELPVGPLLDLLDAFALECQTQQLETWTELTGISRGGAAPVGLLVLRVLGVDRPEMRYWAELVCSALRLTSLLQNLSVERARGRILLPRADMACFDLSPQDLLAGRQSDAAEALIRFEVERVRKLYRQGFPLVLEAGLPAALPFASAWLGGRSILRLVDKAGASVLLKRPGMNVGRFARTLVGAGLSRVPRLVA